MTTPDPSTVRTTVVPTPVFPWKLVAAPVLYLAIAVLAIPAARLHWFGLSANLMLPGGVPPVAGWYGLLGGVVASLSGMFYYNSKWDDSYDLWHIFSGTVGAIYGIAAYLILAMVAHTASSAGAPAAVDSSSPTLLVGAFFLGFSQREFSALGKKVFSIVFHAVDDQAKNLDSNK